MQHKIVFRVHMGKEVKIMINHIERGEIYLADLNPTIGSEQGGVRPVLIIQNDLGNYYSHTTIIATITSKGKYKSKLPTHLFINSRDGLIHDSVILLEQIRTIDKARIIRKLGKLDSKEVKLMNKCMLVSLGVNG